MKFLPRLSEYSGDPDLSGPCRWFTIVLGLNLPVFLFNWGAFNRDDINKLNELLAREIHDSDSEAYLTGPINPINPTNPINPINIIN